ncbi:MAG: AMP-binding protein, partial [Ilumatobacter sp.]|nr:AMP-binding protein [Ilumatobacter sp.]
MTTVTSQDLHDRIAGQNLPKRFLQNVERNGDIEVLNWKAADGSWASKTLNEMAADVARLTAALKDLGMARGDKVVMMIRNRQEFHALDTAVLFCGATPVSIYNSSAPDQIQYLINDCGASVAILEDSGFLERFESVREKIPTIKHIALIETTDETPDDVLRYSDLIAFEPVDLAVEAQTATLDDVATIIYTSGTTGPPKGVMLSHSNVAWTLESVGQSMRDQTDIEDFAGKRHVSYLPMAHVMERLLGH